MKHLNTTIIATIITFIIGVSVVAIWWIKFTPDLKEYSVKFCDLIRESKQYDGKKVRIQAFHRQGVEASFLSDSECEDSIVVTCSLDNEACDNMFNSITAEPNSSKQVRVDVIGRYTDSEFNLFENENVHKFEIFEVKNATFSDIPR